MTAYRTVLMLTCALVFIKPTSAQQINNTMKYQSLTPNIGVRSVNETVKFYTEVLGFKQIVSVPESGELIFAIINAGDVNIMFQQINSLQEEYPELKSHSEKMAATFYIKLQNKNKLYDAIKNSEYLLREMHTTPYGAEEFAIRDNNGLILTFTEDDYTDT